MTALDLLRQIQVLDTRIDADRDRIATIEVTVSDRSAYESARRESQTLTATLKRLEAEQRDIELQAGQTRQQLVDSEQRLYGGRVSSPRELDDLKHKGDELRRHVSAFDERMLTLMEEIEGASTAASTAEGRLREIVADRRTLEAGLLAERKTLAAEIRTSQASRDALRAQVPAANVRLYDRLRETQGGLAVVEVRQRTCQGCRVSMTAGSEQRLRQGGDAIITCQNCGRILFPGEASY